MPTTNTMKKLVFLLHVIFMSPSLATRRQNPDTTTKPLGCYKGNIAEPTLTGYKVQLSKLGVPDCLLTCRDKGFMFGAVHGGKVCACGNGFVSDSDKVSENQCNICPDENWRCGGDRTFNLFQIKNCEKLNVEVLNEMPPYIGCYLDTAARKLTGYFYTDGQLTKNKCFKTCKEAHYLYAGLEAGNQCFCGNEVPQLKDRKSNEECDWYCSGDNTRICGAWWRMSVFAVGICRSD